MSRSDPVSGPSPEEPRDAERVERQLAELRLREPAGLGEQMYRAGWAAALASRSAAPGARSWLWPASTGVAALTSAVLLVLLLQATSASRAPIVIPPRGALQDCAGHRQLIMSAAST